MNFSAIAVGVSPARQQAVSKAIEALPWAEVFHHDDAGRLIVIIEGETTEQEIERLKELRHLEDVGYAELVSHYFEEEAEPTSPETNPVPDYLNNNEETPQANHFQRIKAAGNH